MHLQGPHPISFRALFREFFGNEALPAIQRVFVRVAQWRFAVFAGVGGQSDAIGVVTTRPARSVRLDPPTDPKQAGRDQS